MTEHHCQDPRCECPDRFCAICCHCTCPRGWLTENFGFHRGPYACPQFAVDAKRLERRASQEAGDRE